jgi:hypothetical protein
MEKNLAVMVSNCLEQWNEFPSTAYELNKLSTTNDTLLHFHQWTNGKPLISAFEVVKPGQDGYFFLFIDWHRNGNYYLVIYSHNKSTTVAELNRIIEEEGSFQLEWKYNPLKRDGKNDIRKSYFKQLFGSLTVQIPLPSSPLKVETFIDQLFKLCFNRIRADRIVEIFDPS